MGFKNLLMLDHSLSRLNGLPLVELDSKNDSFLCCLGLISCKIKMCLLKSLSYLSFPVPLGSYA